MRLRREDGKGGGENEREEGIERETMGARGTSICSWSGPALTTHTHSAAYDAWIWLQVVQQEKLCIVKLYSFSIHKSALSLSNEEF